MARKSKAEQENTLDKKVRMDGVGEDPAVKAVLSDDFVQGTNLEATEIAVALQQILRGQQAQGLELAKINQRMNRMDEEALARDKEQKKYIENVLNKAERLKATGAEKDKIMADGIALAQNEFTKARAKIASNALAFEEELKNMPTETVVSPGELVTVMENGQQVSKIMDEVIRIKHKTWVLPPGQAVQVPKIVADRLRQIRRGQEEQRLRKQALSENLEAEKLAKKWREIDGRYSKSEAMPV